jgi:hypothetical protein
MGPGRAEGASDSQAAKPLDSRFLHGQEMGPGRAEGARDSQAAKPLDSRPRGDTRECLQVFQKSRNLHTLGTHFHRILKNRNKKDEVRVWTAKF